MRDFLNVMMNLLLALSILYVGTLSVMMTFDAWLTFVVTFMKRRAREQKFRQELADLLHRDAAAWDCDCFFHRGERAVKRHDFPRTREVRREMLFGTIPMVTMKKET